MRKSDRLFQLTNLLRRPQPISAQQLAQELNVSVRSVYRYIDDLSVNGIPVYGEAGRGYRLQDNFELPALNLTPDELDALLVGVRIVSGWTGTELPASAHSLLHKIYSGLSDAMKHRAQVNIFVPAMRDRQEESKYWEQLRLAIRDQHKIHVQYLTQEGILSSRQLYPLGLFYWGGKWTLGAWCTLRSAYRDFRIDRIQGLTMLDETFETSENLSLVSYIKTQSQNS